MNNFLNIRNIFAAVCMAIITSCASSNVKDTPAKQAAVSNAINTRDFTVAVEVMEPRVTLAIQNVSNEFLRNTGNTANRISLAGDNHTLRITNDSIITRLPYIGERQMGGGYNNTDTGIILNGPIKDYQEKTDPKLGETIISMLATNGIESYNIQLTIQKYGYTLINVTSSQRNSIRYTGELMFLEK